MNKHKNIPTTIDGIRFHSKAEAARYVELKIMANAGAILGLELQPRFDLHVKGTFIGFYKADFAYYYGGVLIVEDVKGQRLPMYKWKKKHVEAEYGIEITEIGAKTRARRRHAARRKRKPATRRLRHQVCAPAH